MPPTFKKKKKKKEEGRRNMRENKIKEKGGLCKWQGEKSGKDVTRIKERKGAGRKREIKRQNLRKIEFNLFFNKKLCSLSDQPKAAKKCGNKIKKTS